MKTKPKTVSQLFPSKWLKAEDLNGRSVIVTIHRCTIEEVHNPLTRQDEYKAILDFNRTKRLVLNKTQCAAIEEITGSETFEHWADVRVMLVPARARNGKPTINILRAPDPDPQPDPTAGTAKNDDDSADTAKNDDGAPIAESGEAGPAQPETQEDFLSV